MIDQLQKTFDFNFPITEEYGCILIVLFNFRNETFMQILVLFLYDIEENVVQKLIGTYDHQMMRQGLKYIGWEKLRSANPEDTKAQPHCSIGFLTSREKSGLENQNQVWGLAFLISPNLLLTAGHSCFSPKLGLQNEDFRFYPGAKGEFKSEVDPIIGVSTRFSQKYRKQAKNRYSEEDYALVKLQRRVDQVAPYMKCLPITPHCYQCKFDLSKQKTLDIYGYSAEKSISYNSTHPNKGTLIHQEGKTSKGEKIIGQIESSNHLINCQMTTFKGQSGCPVINGGNTISVPIQHGNQTNKPNEDFNVCSLITLDALKNLQKWSEQMGADPFQINFENFCPHLRQLPRINFFQGIRVTIAENNLSQEVEKLESIDSTVQLPQIPRELRFDSQTLNSSQLGLQPKTPSGFLRFISYWRRIYQVRRSEVLTQSEKRKKQAALDQEWNKTVYNDWQTVAKFKDATTLVSRKTKLTAFSDHNLFPQLTTLDLAGNSLSSINLQNNKSLNFLNLGSNQLQSITLSHLTNLTVLWLYNNKISKINLASNQNLALIDLNWNCLDQLELPKRGSIAALSVNDNKLKEFRFFYEPAIFSSHEFHSNILGCSITVAYDKSSSNNAKKFLKELKNRYKDYEYVFKAKEIHKGIEKEVDFGKQCMIY